MYIYIYIYIYIYVYIYPHIHMYIIPPAVASLPLLHCCPKLIIIS